MSRKIELITPIRSVKGGMSLDDLIKLTKGKDPKDILIGTAIRFPGQVTIEIYVTEEKEVD
jgi:hypothetical protein